MNHSLTVIPSGEPVPLLAEPRRSRGTLCFALSFAPWCACVCDGRHTVVWGAAKRKVPPLRSLALRSGRDDRVGRFTTANAKLSSRVRICGPCGVGTGRCVRGAGGDRGGEDVPEVERDWVGGHGTDLVLLTDLRFGNAPDARFIASQSARGFARRAWALRRR